jgi:hypothetical protein
MMLQFSAICMLGCLAANAVAQKPKGEPLPPPAKPAITSEQRARAIELLRGHAKASKSVKVLVADYVQTRTTALSKKPLRSSGSFLFRRKPACVVFRAEKPRASIIRLTKELYEVFRPQRKRLERFTLQGPDLSLGLFAAVGGDADRLLADFGIAGFLVAEIAAEGREAPVATGAVTAAISLVPKDRETRERLRELVVTFAVVAKAEGNPVVTLRSVAYRDHSLDLVAIELRNVRSNPKDAPSVAFDVPKDTRVIEHRAGR